MSNQRIQHSASHEPAEAPSTKHRIIHAALLLIAEQGLSQVTMVDIARSAGVARQTLYNHYADIPSILSDALTHHDAAAVNDLEQALSVVDTPGDTIGQLVRHVAAISTHSGHTLNSHLSLPDHLQENLSGFDHALDGCIRLALADGVESGEFRPDLNIETDSALIRHALNGVSELVAASPAHAPRIVTSATRTLLAALEKGSKS